MNRFEKHEKAFSEENLFTKIQNYAKQAGLKAIYSVLLLFHAYKRKETPTWARSIILGALGYFISPIDALPDLSPIIGYTDDMGVLVFGLVTIAAYVNDDVRIKSRKQLRKWFGKYDLADLKEIDEQI